MKRWMPLTGIVLIAIISLVYLLVGQADRLYIPTTDKPEIIYKQACAGCHGINGEGKHLVYPNLAKGKIEKAEIRSVIQNGSMLMPAFRSIKGDTLKLLVTYVHEKRFLNQE